MRSKPTHADRRLQLGCSMLAVLTLAAGSAAAAPEARQSLDDAWWTGSLLAPSAATLPHGHLLVETYVYDVRPYGRFDKGGHQSSVSREDDYGSLTYLNYGLADRLTVGVVPHFGYRRPSQGADSTGLGIGDVSAQAQYRLTQYQAGGRVPTISVNLMENLPLGRHDRLEGRPNDGFGSGAWATTGSLYAQMPFWTPNGRILRTRLDLSYTISDAAGLKGQSVYGTPTGFRGHALPGDSFVGLMAFEYSVTREWVLALDLSYERDGATKVSGPPPATFTARYPVGESFIVAPAIEYSWRPDLGVIVGARIVPAGRNVTASVAPVIAINWVR